MADIEFRTLGSLDLRGPDGRELHSLLAQPKRIALLAYLSIAEPRGYHRRDTLLGLFWGDSDQEHARTSLRKAIHVLRRALGEAIIVSRGDEELAVDASRITCDVVAFESALREKRFDEATQLYTGDLLPGFFVDDAAEFERWLNSERSRLRTEAARAAYTAAENSEAQGDINGAQRFARRSLRLAETDERTLRKLMQLQLRAGDRAAAIDTYDNFARSLAAEYVTKPSSETSALVERIRAGDPLLAGLPVSPTTSIDRAADGEPHAPRGLLSKTHAPLWNRERILLAFAAIAVLVSAGFVWAFIRPSGSAQVVRNVLVVDSSETMSPGDGWWSRIAISPDGTTLAYVGGPHGELLVRPRSQLHGSVIRETKGAETPFFSPDGQRVGFLRELHVYIASRDGTPPITVCDSLTGVAGASWAPDGFIYVDGRAYQPLFRVAARAGATPRAFTALDTTKHEIDHTWPDALPNGKGVLFGVTSQVTPDSLGYSIAVAEISTGKHRVIIPDAMYARYASSGHVLYITTSKQLMVAPFDQNSMRVTGEPKVVMDNMRLGRFGAADLAVAANGTLVYAIGGGSGKRELVWVTRQGQVDQIDPEWLGDFWSPTVSPEGERLAVTRRLNTSRFDIFVKRLDRGPSVRLTLQATDGGHPAWTPDGKYVTYSDAEERPEVWRSRADGAGAPTLLFRESRMLASEQWSPDSKWLIYGTTPSAPDSGDIDGFRPGVDKTPSSLIATKHTERTPALSPNGRWLAYASNETGQLQVYVVPFPNVSGGKWAISTAGGSDPHWSHRGDELFYRDSTDSLVAAAISTTPTLKVRRSTRLFSTGQFQSSPLVGARMFAVSADDHRFIFVRRAKEPADQIVVVDNWFAELKRRPPDDE